MRILADASFPDLSTLFPAPFVISLYTNYQELLSLINQQDILLCRSTLKVDADLLKNTRLKYIATASSGTDHIDHNFLAAQNIPLIDAKGANASAVADYVVACLAWLEQRDFIKGYKAGIIGMGEVGSRVCKRLQAANYQTICYDPLKSLARQEFITCAIEELYKVDLLCIHASLHDNLPYPSTNLVNKPFLERLKSGCVLINAARGGIVNEEALLLSKNKLTYCTDVYHNEPAINGCIVNKATLCTPHIAGHSIEAKKAALVLVCEKLHHLLGLTAPSFKIPRAPFSFTSMLNGPAKPSWQDKILSWYNPEEETSFLKQARDKQAAFLSLRAKHTKRHDFSVYSHSTEFN